MKYILILLFSFTLQAQSLLLLFDDAKTETVPAPVLLFSSDPELQTPPLLTATDYAGSRIGMFLGGMETAQAGVAKGWAYDGVNDALSFPWTAPAIWTMTATSSANPTLTLQGTDYISIDWGDSTITTVLLTTSDQNISHTYTKNMQRSVRFINSEKITKFQTASNLNWTFNLSTFPASVNFIYIGGSNTITGNVADFKTGLLNIAITGSNTISGNLADFKTGVKYIYIAGANTITGNVADFKTGLTIISITGSNTITGNVADFKTGLTIINITGSNTITDYTSKTWWDGINYITINPTTGYGLNSTEVDNLIIDLSAATWSGTSKTLELKGSNAAPTSASASARTSLQAQGVNVTTN